MNKIILLATGRTIFHFVRFSL